MRREYRTAPGGRLAPGDDPVQLDWTRPTGLVSAPDRAHLARGLAQCWEGRQGWPRGTSIGIVSNGYAVVGGGDGADVSFVNSDLPDRPHPTTPWPPSGRTSIRVPVVR